MITNQDILTSNLQSILAFDESSSDSNISMNFPNLIQEKSQEIQCTTDPGTIKFSLQEKEENSINFRQSFNYREELSEAQEVMNDCDYLVEEQIQKEPQPKPKRRRRSKLDSGDVESKKELKNYLAMAKKCFVKMLENKPEIKDLEFFVNFQSQNKTCRREFEEFFNYPEMRSCLAQDFLNRKLKREVNLARIDVENRKLYRKKTNLMKRAFILGKLPNL